MDRSLQYSFVVLEIAVIVFLSPLESLLPAGPSHEQALRREGTKAILET